MLGEPLHKQHPYYHHLHPSSASDAPSPPPQPPNPQPEEVRTLAARAIEDARRLPEMPPFVDYSSLLADLQRWIAELEGAAADVDRAQEVR